MGNAAQTDSQPRIADLGGPALRAFFNIAEVWELTDREQMKILGLVSVSQLHRWKDGKVSKVSRDTLERISYVLGIFKAIRILLPDPQRADRWVRSPNAASPFNGRPAIERMTAGNVADLYVVRQYLEAQRV